MARLEEQNAILQRQAEYFASDERIKERAAIWHGVSPEECLAAEDELCRDAEVLHEMMDPEVRARADQWTDPLPPDTIAILESLWRTRPRAR